MVFKWLEPPFSGNHGNRTLRTTGREERGGGGVEGGDGGNCGEWGRCLYLMISADVNLRLVEPKWNAVGVFLATGQIKVPFNANLNKNERELQKE